MKKGGEWRRLVLVEVLVGNGDSHLSPGDSPHLLQGVLKKLECILIPEVSERQARSHCLWKKRTICRTSPFPIFPYLSLSFQTSLGFSWQVHAHVCTFRFLAQLGYSGVWLCCGGDLLPSEALFKWFRQRIFMKSTRESWTSDESQTNHWWTTVESTWWFGRCTAVFSQNCFLLISKGCSGCTYSPLLVCQLSVTPLRQWSVVWHRWFVNCCTLAADVQGWGQTNLLITSYGFLVDDVVDPSDAPASQRSMIELS